MDLKGDPVARVWSSSGGNDWTDQTDMIKDMDSAVVIGGISEFGGRAAFFGQDNMSVSKAYVVYSSTLKLQAVLL